MIRWTGLAPWEFEFPFPGSLTSTFLALTQHDAGAVQVGGGDQGIGGDVGPQGGGASTLNPKP